TLVTMNFGLVYVDVLPATGIIIASLLVHAGNENRVEVKKILYATGLSFISMFILIHILISANLSYVPIFGPLGLLITFSYWSAARIVWHMQVQHTKEYYTLFIGFIILGSSTLLYVFHSIDWVLAINLFIIISGIIWVGVGMIVFFIQDTSEQLKVHHHIGQITTGVLQHDIRNYVTTLRGSIQQAQESTSDQQMWLKIASETIADMLSFVNEMSELSSSLSRFAAKGAPLNLSKTIERVSMRVTREYSLSPEQIVVAVSPDIEALTSTLLREMLWNIFDNAFKHGASKLVVELAHDQSNLILKIIDDAGGVSDKVQDFLNNPDELMDSDAPGVGLGIILIRGLASLCNVSLKVLKTESPRPQGTIHQLGLRRVID
ncbi:MAG: ATP-binding protein, partial [Candidatus Thorarchaeota archaeon]